jgi:hypothetical protein
MMKLIVALRNFANAPKKNKNKQQNLWRIKLLLRSAAGNVI